MMIGGSIVGKAQVISDPQSNRPYYSSLNDQTGNPLILDSWESGTILSEKGIRYKGIQVNYDAIQKSVVFKTGESVYLFNEPVQEFTVGPDAEGRIRRFVRSDKTHPELPAVFIEVLASGRICFYKHVAKSVVEVTDYNSVPRKNIESKTSYFLTQDGKLKRVILSKKGLQEALPDHSTRLESFMSQNGLSPKNEADWIKIIESCNK